MEITMSEDIKKEVVEAFEEAVSQGKSPDEVKVAMLTAGAEFSGINKLYNQLMIDTGRMSNPAEKAAVVAKACEDNDISTQEGFDAAVNQILESLTGITSRSAEASIRGYARKNEMEYYHKPKTGGAGRIGGFRKKYFDWLRNHPNATDEEITDLLVTYGTKNVARHESFYRDLAKLVNDVANGVTVEEPEFSEPEEGNRFNDFVSKPKEESEDPEASDESKEGEAA